MQCVKIFSTAAPPPPELGGTPSLTLMEFVWGVGKDPSPTRFDCSGQPPVMQFFLCFLKSILCPPLPASPPLDPRIDLHWVTWVSVLCHVSGTYYLEFLLQGFEGQLQFVMSLEFDADLILWQPQSPVEADGATGFWVKCRARFNTSFLFSRRPTKFSSDITRVWDSSCTLCMKCYLVLEQSLPMLCGLPCWPPSVAALTGQTALLVRRSIKLLHLPNSCSLSRSLCACLRCWSISFCM